jgi:hypothetical protein
MYCQSYCNMCVHLHQPFQPGLQPKWSCPWSPTFSGLGEAGCQEWHVNTYM